jgi:hypothetical protein
MPNCAGIALGRITDRAPVFCTIGDHTSSESFGPTTEHKLDGDSTLDIIKTVNEIMSLGPIRPKTEVALSHPIYLSDEQRKSFYKVHLYIHDHCAAFLNGCHFGIEESEGEVDSLFLDLTPGQVAVSLVRGVISDGEWCISKGKQVALTVLGTVDLVSVQEIFDKLIIPTAPSLAALQCVGILRPEGAFPSISNCELASRFLDIPVKWLSVADLSYGSAVWMYRRQRFFDDVKHLSPLTLGIKVASGEIVNIIPEDFPLPTTRQFYFTTSRDHQTTATLQIFRGSVLCGQVILKGLIPGLRSTARIKVSAEWVYCRTSYMTCDLTTIYAEELGSMVQAKVNLGGVDWADVQRNPGYWESVKQLPLAFGRDGVIGELPE